MMGLIHFESVFWHDVYINPEDVSRVELAPFTQSKESFVHFVSDGGRVMVIGQPKEVIEKLKTTLPTTE